MQETINKIELRNLQIEDYKELKNSMMEAYSELENSYWKEHHIEKLLSIFPEGQLVVLVDDKVVGSALSLIIDYNKVIANHTYAQITGNYTFSTHNPNGRSGLWRSDRRNRTANHRRYRKPGCRDHSDGRWPSQPDRKQRYVPER